MLNGMPIIALEEHYYDKELAEAFGGGGGPPPIIKKLYDLEDERLAAMDRAEVAINVLSHAAPSGQAFAGDKAVDLCKGANDRLAELCARHPDRFYGFASLPTGAPDKAADELERCVKDLKFVGTMLHGPTAGKFHDDKFFWPVFERAEALDVPVYIHPAQPMQVVADAYYQDYAKDFPSITSAGWGFGIETATACIRLILSGLFQKHPNLKIIVGHLGEMIPFFLWRINSSLSRPGHKDVKFRETFCKNFWLTTSGCFSTPALLCAMQEMGMDRIMFSTDWPYVEHTEGVEWMKTLQISPDDMEKLVNGNAKKILKI